MKKTLLLLFAYSFIVSTSRSQSTATSIYGQYIWTQATILKPCDDQGNDDHSESIRLSEPKQKFKVLKLIEGEKTAIIQILNYRGASNAFYKYNFFGDSADLSNFTTEHIKANLLGDHQAYFKVAVDDINKFAAKDFIESASLAFGVINFPFKLRPQKGLGDFSGSFNFGAAIGVKFAHRSWRKISNSIITAYSISNINLDSVSVTHNQDKLTSTNNFTAFSFSIGYLLEYDKIQVGLFIGWDQLSRINQLNFGWRYQGKPWISIGFGYAIFSSSKATEAAENKQQGQ